MLKLRIRCALPMPGADAVGAAPRRRRPIPRREVQAVMVGRSTDTILIANRDLIGADWVYQCNIPDQGL